MWPVAVFVLGGASTWGRDLLTEGHQRRREMDARKAERAKAVVERRETFELDHLQKLNDAFNDLGRAAGHAHFIDMQTSRQTGVYAGTQLTEQASDAFLLANRGVYTLLGLVLDDELRAQVEAAHAAVNAPSRMHGAELAVAELAYNRSVLALDAAQAGISQRIREMYLGREM